MSGHSKITSMKALRSAEAACTRCPLYRHATQVVPGEGQRRSRIMLLGEQPGDKEDREGRPFVGAAGRVLDAALVDAGIERRITFVTNAVKHFKFLERGKRRLHKRPNAYEIERCRVWLDVERELLRPDVIVALGATAARSLSGRPVTISKTRGRLMPLGDSCSWLVTVHPSYLLRIKDKSEKAQQYRAFVRDLRRCRTAIT